MLHSALHQALGRRRAFLAAARLWHLMTLLSLLLVVGCATTESLVDTGVPRETIRVLVPAGAANVDVYWPQAAEPAPLVIIAHGFMRSRRNMAGWGQFLAVEGMVVAVPDLPTRADHVRNAEFLSQLLVYLREESAWAPTVDVTRSGLLGFSAGGLSTLLAAAEGPGVAIWIGLDPVDREGLGVQAASQFAGRAVIITAEPSSCNAGGNARELIAVLPQSEHFSVTGAGHVDGEWPSSWDAELACGRGSDQGRAEFRRRVIDALREAFSSTVPYMPED